MGAVESTDEENSVIRFVDSVEIRHEKDTSSYGQEHVSTDFVPDGRDWISHVPKADDSHGIATVAPADTMLYEGTYEDFEILGDTAVQTSNEGDFEIAGSQADLNIEEEDESPEGLKYFKPPRRTSYKKKAKDVQDGGKSSSRDSVLSVLNSSSKLASLFGQDRASFTGGNESLTYTAPKQPKKEKQAGGGETAILCATAVHAYKYVNGQYASQGKLGAAVLANHSANDYKILIYASKQQQVTTGKIHGNFSFTVQGSNYASFYDDQRQTWSLCFNSDKDITNFAKQVGLSKFNSASSTLCTQDLIPGDGMAIELGDALEVKYTGWLWTNNNFGKVFDGNTETDKTFKFKTGKGKVIKGWEQGVIGMKKGGKRLIAIPSTLAYGEKGVPSRVPPNSPLLFEVDVLRIKSNRETTESPVTFQEPATPQNTDRLPDILAEPSGSRKRSTDSISQLSAPIDSGIKGRTASITEQLSQSPEKGTDKARLLARMSKMGKNPLSIPGAVAAEPENYDMMVESEQEIPPSAEPHVRDRTESNTTSPPPISSNPHPNVRAKPHPPPRPASFQVHPEVHQPIHNPAPPAPQPIQQPVMNPQPMMQPAFTPQQQVALYQPPMSMPSMGYPMMAPQPHIITAPYAVPPPPAPPPPPQPTANDAMVPVLMAETRQQQGEIRMSIGKLSDKIDELSNKVERHQQSSGHMAGQLTPVGQMGVGAFGNPQAAMEAAVLVHNINRIVQENEKLKAEGTEKTKKIELLNDKISDLLQKNQRFVEQSNTMLEQRSDSLQVNSAQSQARVLSLEQERISMSGELTTAKTHLASLQNEVTSLRQKEAELSSQLSKVTSEAEKFRNELTRTKDSHTESAEQGDKLKQSLKEEKQTRKRLESKVDHIEEELNDLKHEKETLERGLGDRKKKHVADKKKFEEELEELRAQQEEEIKFLKEKHRKEKQSSGSVTAKQVSQAEAELETRWTEKAEKMVAQTEEKWKRRFQEVSDEKEETFQKLAEFQEKCSTLKTREDEQDEKIKDLQEKLEDLEGIREKYTRLQASQGDKDSEMETLRTTQQELDALQTKYQEVRSRTLKMKERFEEQLASAEEERESAVSEAYSKGVKEGKEQAGANKEQPSVNVADEVKRIMNTVFYMLRSEFEADDTYTGSDIMAVILKTIKEVTVKLVSGKSVEKKDSEGEEQEEEDDEEEEEEEEEEEAKDEDEDDEEADDEEEDDDEEEEAKVEGKEEEKLVNGELVEKEESEDEDEEESEEEEVEEKHKQIKQGVDEVDEEDEGDDEKESSTAVTEEERESDNTQKEELGVNVEQQMEQKEDLKTSEESKQDDNSVEPEVVIEDSNDGILESSNGPESKENIDNTDNSSEDDSFQGNQIDVPSLEELSEEADDENSRTELDRTVDSSPENVAQSVPDESKESPPEPFHIAVAEEKEELPKEEQGTQEAQVDTAQSNTTSEDKLKSLFGDDGHDDVEATFGSLSKKKEEEKPDSPPPRDVPPPLFDDDDDDDLDWFK
ncbi:FK506-binding protein 15 [Desmophyllum pertusum]|uniref:peptidylprolyl isomerase n=1 Tax=Desmophyllum pertusum TaxID=174260 RepID=A0A9W9YD91_9CNID|nr:FK506-binding protein 15 [Desmophyllum pertusum]